MMNIAEYSIRNSVVIVVVTLVLLGAGYTSFQKLPRLEEPEYTIKEAIVLTPYPGASAAEVEEEVSDVIEKAAQQLGQLKRVESRSSRGLSVVKVFIKEGYEKEDLRQVWDELRRKVNDSRTDLPPGAGPSLVNDDFGDVYGVYLALTGEGYTYKDLYETAKFLQRELLQVADVKRVEILGNQQEVIYVEMLREKMAELRISPQDIYVALASKNLVTSAGRAVVGPERIPLNPTGAFTSEKQFRDLLVRGRTPGDDSLVYLGDVASIVRGYQEPPRNIVHHGGKPAVCIGVSTVEGGNVVKMGQAIDKRMQELLPQMPLGIDIGTIALQSREVVTAIKNFVINLVEAVLIVVVVLLIFMGLRSGLIIGTVLLVTIMGSFIFVEMKGLILERVSLGSLIIALGMLVDNAIVVTDGMRVRMQAGKRSLDAAKEVVGQTAMPLLGATAIAILAFAPIGLSQDDTGEICRSLFFVVLFSLGLSWFTAVTTTPLLCHTFLKQAKQEPGTAGKDPYAGVLFRSYRGVLRASIRFRWVTVTAVIAMFMASLIGFNTLKQNFFPDSTRAQFMVDCWFPEGTRIEETADRAWKAEEHLRQLEGVAAQCALIGVAKADLYPHFSLFGSIGLRTSDTASILPGGPSGIDIGDLAKSGSLQWFAGPSFTWDIFNYGRIKNRIRVEDARFQQLEIGYRNTVLRAVQEVEDGLVGFIQARDARDFYREAVTTAERSVRISLVQYREGLVDYQRVLDAQRALASSQDAFVFSEGSVATNLIAAYRALGGGWEIRIGKDFVPASIKEEMKNRTDWGELASFQSLEAKQ